MEDIQEPNKKVYFGEFREGNFSISQGFLGERRLGIPEMDGSRIPKTSLKKLFSVAGGEWFQGDFSKLAQHVEYTGENRPGIERRGGPYFVMKSSEARAFDSIDYDVFVRD